MTDAAQTTLFPAASRPPRGGPSSSGHDRPAQTTVPARPTPTSLLTGGCPEGGRWPEVKHDGTIAAHQYPKWDAKSRRGRCAGTNQPPTRLAWREPI